MLFSIVRDVGNWERDPQLTQMQNLKAAFEEIEKWDIPSSIYTPIASIHKEEEESASTDEKILQLSYVLALDNVNPEIYPSYHNLKPELHEALSLNREDLEDALDITNLQCISVISLFNPNAFMLY